MSILTAAGQPVLAKSIKDMLAAVDPRLGLVIVPNAIGDGQTLWGVTLWWADSDPRRAAIREGRAAPDSAFDIIGYLPKDCDVSSAFDYICRRFRVLSSKDDIKTMLSNVHRFNQERKAEIMRPTKELMEELVSTNARHIAKGVGGGWGSSLDVGPRSKRDEKDWQSYLRDGGSDGSER